MVWRYRPRAWEFVREALTFFRPVIAGSGGVIEQHNGFKVARKGRTVRGSVTGLILTGGRLKSISYLNSKSTYFIYIYMNKSPASLCCFPRLHNALFQVVHYIAVFKNLLFYRPVVNNALKSRCGGCTS